MNTVRLTLSRTIGRTHSLFSTALAVGGFLAAAGALFAFALEGAEGGSLALPAVWALSVAPFAPVLAALLAMDVWSDEIRSGRIDVLLSTSVTERDLVLGKFFGVYAMTFGALVLSLAATLAALALLAPSALASVGALDVGPALVALAIQTALWSAVSVATSAAFGHAAVAAVASVALTVALPRGIWLGLAAWSRAGRTAFGEMPFDAHVLDIASGTLPLDVVACYLAGTLAFLFTAAKLVALRRFVGCGQFLARAASVAAIALSFAAAALVVSLAMAVDVTFELPAAGGTAALSARTRSILAETSGRVTVTCFLPRSDGRFKPVGRFLRRLCRESVSVGGARVEISYVDPRWDIGAAERLIRRGVAEDALVFERGRRMVAIPFRDGYGERVCASAIRRLSTNPRRRHVYWTVGHGEKRVDDYGTFGMSDLARELARDGFVNRSLDLAAVEQVPGDAALVVVAGAREPLSRKEIGRLDAYLRGGGRLLALLESARDDGVAAFLPTWGIRPVSGAVDGAPTLSGSDVIVSDFGDHPITAPLRGARLVFESPVAFVPSAVVAAGSGADRIEFVALARAGEAALAVAAERGVGAGSDLAIRPTRIVAVGDARFAMNGPLAARANANRDFLLNCAAYLSGTDVVASQGEEASVLVTGMDRTDRLVFLAATAGALPACVFVVLFAVAARRRFRS